MECLLCAFGYAVPFNLVKRAFQPLAKNTSLTVRN